MPQPAMSRHAANISLTLSFISFAIDIYMDSPFGLYSTSAQVQAGPQGVPMGSFRSRRFSGSESPAGLLPVLTAHALHAAVKLSELSVDRGHVLHALIDLHQCGIKAIGEAVVLLVVDLYTVHMEVGQV
jgi:hypothetical protein